jgi:hypothetical protein
MIAITASAKPTSSAWLHGSPEARQHSRHLTVTWPELSRPLVDAPAAPVVLPLAEAPAEPALTFTEAEVARLCAASAATARVAALAEVTAGAQALEAASLARMADGLTSLAAAIGARREALRGGAVSVGAALGRLLAWRALAEEPLAVAEALLGEILPGLEAGTEVTIEVPPSQRAGLAERLAAVAQDAQNPIAVEVRAASDLRLGEARLRWRDGWAERLLRQLEAEASTALAAVADFPTEADMPAIDSLTIEEISR